MTSTHDDSHELKRTSWKEVFVTNLSLLFICFAVFFVDLLLGFKLSAIFGLEPRKINGLDGVFLSPFLHANWTHITSNATAFLVVSTILLRKSYTEFWTACVTSAIISGLLTWLIASYNTIHIGASGVIFGLAGMVLGNAVFSRQLIDYVALSLVLLIYPSMLLSPILFGFSAQSGISWEMHSFGFLGGLFASYLVRNK